jgi:hypothetical protein
VEIKLLAGRPMFRHRRFLSASVNHSDASGTM